MVLVFLPVNQAYAFATTKERKGRILKPEELALVPVNGVTLFQTRDSAIRAVQRMGLELDRYDQVYRP